MGLVLGVWKNERIYIEKDYFTVVEVTGQQSFVLENQDGTGFTIEADSVHSAGQEVIPEVFVKAAPPRGGLPRFQARLYIDAPRDLLIMRERPYKATEVLVRARILIENMQAALGGPPAEEETATLDAIEREIRQNRRK